MKLAVPCANSGKSFLKDFKISCEGWIGSEVVMFYTLKQKVFFFISSEL